MMRSTFQPNPTRRPMVVLVAIICSLGLVAVFLGGVLVGGIR